MLTPQEKAALAHQLIEELDSVSDVTSPDWLSISSEAEEEMSEAALFYEAASVGLRADFLDDLQQAINTLRVHPEIGTHVDTHLRRVLHRFPFSLIYA